MNIARIKITPGTINHGNISVAKHLGMFPVDSIGGRNKDSQASRLVKLHLVGGEVIETDIYEDKKAFRYGRPTVKTWVKQANAKLGDFICIERIDDYSYKVWIEKFSSSSPIQELATSNEHASQFKQYDEEQNCMNTILYGPPGTGKTYRTAELAVKICDGKVPESRLLLMQRYEELRRGERIKFVTFHQSYGYEDFVEGLRPELKDGQISYRVRPGIFRETCDVARRSTLVKPGLSGTPLKDRTIYKMSLGIAGSNEGKIAFQECIEKGYVLLGYGHDVDFSECKTAEEIRKKVDDEGTFEKPESHARYVSVFKDELQVGDIVVISQGNRAFRAIGEVTGEYEFLEAAAAGYFHQMRTVRWLAVLEGNRTVQDIYDRNFVQSSLYKLDHGGLQLEVLEDIIKGQQDAGAGNQSFVLIIDEINRANISKVFGELITLLEPDKRAGKINAITVQLPSSGDSFSVPSNLYVIATMNTADRSIALLDTALRRRFDFEELQPDHTVLHSVDTVDLGAMLKKLNQNVEFLYDRDHTIGHAYFMNVKTLADLDVVFRRKVIPLLQEYFYEDLAKVRSVLSDDGGFFIEEEIFAPKGLDGNGSKFRYTLRDKFPLEAYLKIYQ